MADVLVVEDNYEIRSNLVEFLESKGHRVDNTDDGLRALGLFQVNSYDILVLDVMLPGLNGFDLCEQIRKAHNNVPIIFLTALGTVDDRIKGLLKGADDYIVKPFSLTELNLRIEAILKRTNRPDTEILKVADLEMNQSTKSVKRGRKEVLLNPTAYKILRILLINAPAVVSRHTLENEIWKHTPPDSDSLRTHMHYLRTAIDKGFDKKLLKTRSGFGWYLSSDD